MNENLEGICPFCQNSDLYECVENGVQMMLCLNCGQLFPVKKSMKPLPSLEQNEAPGSEENQILEHNEAHGSEENSDLQE